MLQGIIHVADKASLNKDCNRNMGYPRLLHDPQHRDNYTEFYSNIFK